MLRGPLIVRSATFYDSYLNQDITVRQFAFYCDISYPQQTNDDGARFRVTLRFDDKTYDDIVAQDANSTHLSSEIVETLLRGNFGKELQCVVKSYWFGNENPEMSDAMISSNRYWIGIKSTAEVVKVDDSPTTNRMMYVTYQSTVPITCWHCYDGCGCSPQCNYNYVVGGSGMNIGSCKNTIYEAPHNSNSTFGFDAQVTQNFPQPVSYYTLFFQPNYDYAQCAEHIWKGYIIPNVSVVYTQTAPLMYCKSETDPHITTINGLYIDNMNEGTYNLLSSLPDHYDMLLRIQVRQVRCNGENIACNCAVIVREWNNALMVDACKYAITYAPVPSLSIVTLLQPSESSASMTVARDTTGQKTVVTSPSGLEVTIYTNSYFSIEIKIPGFYNGSVDGLCTDTAPNNPKFSLTDDDPDNMFTHSLNCTFVSAQDFECVCDTDGDTCTGNPTGTTVEVAPKSLGNVCGNARKRFRGESWVPAIMKSATTSDDYIDPDEVYYIIPPDPNYMPDTDATFPTQSGLTEQNATDYCRNTLKTSSAYDSCSGKFDEVKVLQGCIEDVKFTDTLAGAGTYRAMMESVCTTFLFVEWNVTSAEQAESIPAVKSVTDNMCPNACTERGTCSDGVCSCSAGYVGPDCGIESNTPAVLLSLYRGGLCNLQDRECAHTNTIVSNVYDSPQLTCKYTRFHLTNSSVPTTTVQMQGLLNTVGEVRCPSPNEDVTDGRRQSYGYRLSVSNDKALYSNELSLTVYDSGCLTCVENATSCQLVVNTCFIDGLCYAADYRSNASTNCLACVPSTSMTTWTDSAVWSAWGECSRQCDTGVTQRYLECTSLQLDVETDFCVTQKCPGSTAERMQGVIVTTTSDDVKLILLDQSDFFVEISKAVNVYCGSHASDCCTALGLTGSGAGGISTMNVTTPEQSYYAAGFPDIVSDPARNKIIVQADTTIVREQCTGTSSLSPIIYFNNTIIQAAIKQEKKQH